MTKEQEEALRDYLQESIVPLIEQVLVKKLGQAMSFAAEQLVQPQRTWVGLTDEEADEIQRNASYTAKGLLKALEAKLKEKNT
jgi:hypothetical protein